MPDSPDRKGRRVGPVVRLVLRRAGEELLRWAFDHALNALVPGVVVALGLHGPLFPR